MIFADTNGLYCELIITEYGFYDFYESFKLERSSV